MKNDSLLPLLRDAMKKRNQQLSVTAEEMCRLFTHELYQRDQDIADIRNERAMHKQWVRERVKQPEEA